MLRILLIGSACVLLSSVSAQNIGINTGGTAPNPDAILDIDVSSLGAKRGLLIPRMTEAQRLAIPTAGPENGLLVYQTDVGAGTDSTNRRGFWFWDANATPATWVHLGVVRRGWLLTGNTVTSVTLGNPEFLGTLSQVGGYIPNRNLIIRSVPPPANPAMQMGHAVQDFQAGFVGLGTAAPATERLEVQGAIRLNQNGANHLQVSPPRQGTIRYGTKDALPSNAANLNWHWGTLDTNGTVYWTRMQNAEELITPPKPFALDTVACLGQTGFAFRGNLSPIPVTQTTTNPANIYSPFATNYTSANNEGNFRVQYLYRYEELVEAGICFTPNATIYGFSFFCLDQETLDNAPAPPAYPGLWPTEIEGEVRGGAATIAGLTGPTAYFGLMHNVPYMDDPIRTGPVRLSFSHLNPAPGWVTFNLTSPITLGPAQNLILDIVWSRNKGIGKGPKVELEDPGFACTKWVAQQNTLGTSANRNALDDFPLTAGANVNPTAANPHTKRPVTRFNATVATPTSVLRHANYLLYEGGIMVGDPAWAAAPGTFKGPGTVKAQNGVYDGTVLLSDHVFDLYFDGQTLPGEGPAQTGYAYTGLAQLRERLEQERHLPNMPSRQQWESSGGASMGKLATGLWQTLEEQALYIAQMEQDLSALEELSFGEQLTPEQAEELAREVMASRRLTEAQKTHLVGLVRSKYNTPNTPAK